MAAEQERICSSAFVSIEHTDVQLMECSSGVLAIRATVQKAPLGRSFTVCVSHPLSSRTVRVIRSTADRLFEIRECLPHLDGLLGKVLKHAVSSDSCVPFPGALPSGRRSGGSSLFLKGPGSSLVAALFLPPRLVALSPRTASISSLPLASWERSRLAASDVGSSLALPCRLRRPAFQQYSDEACWSSELTASLPIC